MLMKQGKKEEAEEEKEMSLRQSLNGRWHFSYASCPKERIADFYKALADSTRIKILYTLFKEDMCVCDIAELLSMTQSAISHQLRVLKQAKLVKARRDGKQVIYSLDDQHISAIISLGMEHIEE